MKRFKLEVKVTLLMLLGVACLMITSVHFLGNKRMPYLTDDGLMESILEAPKSIVTALSAVAIIAICMAVHAMNRDERIGGEKAPIENWKASHSKVMGKSRIFPH